MQEPTPLNVEKLLQDEVATEYRTSVKLLGYIAALLCDHNRLDELALLIADRLNIDTQKGRNLDVIGEIVGISRGVIAASGVKFFGFAPHPLANGFGRKGNPTIGGRFRARGEAITGSKLLSDSEYRQFIRAQIFKNHAQSTPDQIIQFLKLILGASTPVFLKNATPAPGHATISFGRILSLDEQYLLTDTALVPTTVGVTYHYEFPVIPPLVINELTVVI